jgi:hypothetical protein
MFRACVRACACACVRAHETCGGWQLRGARAQAAGFEPIVLALHEFFWTESAAAQQLSAVLAALAVRVRRGSHGAMLATRSNAYSGPYDANSGPYTTACDGS